MKIGNLEVYGIIYKITNKINGKVYIGQTVNGFDKRYIYKGEGIEKVYKYHSKYRELNQYYNEHLLRAIEKYGFDSFNVVKCLDFAFSKVELDIKEMTWIKYYGSRINGYNKNIGGDGNCGYDGLKGENNPNSKKVIQLTLDGEYIKEWTCMSEAEKDLGIAERKISACCLGDRKSSGGFMWIFSECYDGNISPYDGYIQYKRRVLKLSLDGEILGRYQSLKDAEAQNEGSDFRNIQKCCKQERNVHNGFIWVYEDEFDYDKKYSYNGKKPSRTRRVEQYDKEGNYIESYNTLKEAYEKYNGCRSTMIRACSGKLKTAYGYIWKYESKYEEEYLNSQSLKKVV